MRVVVRVLGSALCVAALGACAEPFYCTPGAAIWQVTVLSPDGTPVTTGLRWTAVIERTQDSANADALAAYSDASSGTYAVFYDAMRVRLDPAGDVVHVEGAAGSNWFAADFVFAVPDQECHANRVSGPDTVTLAPASFGLVDGQQLWGGDYARVVSPVHRLVDSLPFLVDGDTVWSRHVAGDTAGVTVPVNTGEYAVAAVRPDGAESLGTVAVRGYGGFADGPPLTGVVMRWPPDTPNPTFLANGPDRLQLFDAASRSVVTSYPDSIHHPAAGGAWDACPQGIGPTYDPYTVVLCPEPGTLQAWDLEADPVPIDVPQTGWGSLRMAALAAPGRWLIGLHHYVVVSGGLDIWIEEPQVMRISPHGDRVVVVGNGQLDGVVVFDTAGLVPAYYIEELVGRCCLVGAGFTADGGTLYAAVQTHDSMQVAAVAADDGEMLAYTALTALASWQLAMLVDQRGTYVFLIGGRTYYDRRTVFRVLDAGSLDLVAEIELPELTCQTYPPDYSPVGLVQDEAESRVYAVWGRGDWQTAPPDNSCIEWFDVW